MRCTHPACISMALLTVLAAGCGKPAKPPADQVPVVVEPPAPISSPPAALLTRNPDGATLTYTRSNQDGTKPERILVHIVSDTEVHVAKMVERCTDAAYVTAVFDPATGEATRLVGGRLQRDSTQQPQAFLDFDKTTRKISVRLGDPGATPSETLTAPPAPWRMYDFDFAEFALFGPRGQNYGGVDGASQRSRESNDFSFGLALAWPDTAPPLVQSLGEAKAQLMVVSKPDGYDVGRFALYSISGPAFGPDGGGVLKLDARRGHVIEAQLSRPNHSGYEDFMLKLESVADADGPEIWRNALAAHWKDCPA